MPKTKEQKKQTLAELEDNFKKSKAAVFVNFQGLNVKDVTALRNILRKEKIEYEVAKKTLLKLAVEKTGQEGVDPKSFDGNIAVVFGFEDEVMPAKVLNQFGATHEALKIIGGTLENKFIDAAKVMELANIPGKQELLAKLVGSINSPVSGFVNVLAGNLRGLVQVLKAASEKKTA
ncbi:MAG: 50S ribosomal protein L10 [Patescibacteria group bacterium]